MLRNFTLYLLLLLPAFMAAQDTLSGRYPTLRLTKEVYYISGSVVVDSAFVVEEGVSVLFFDGASLLCLGTVSSQGTSESRVVFQNAGTKRGGGLIIKGQRNSDTVSFRFSQFIGLSPVLRFESSWSRKSVTISYCEFLSNNPTVPVITIMSPFFEAGSDNPMIDFLLQQSLFTKNGPALFVEDMISNNFTLQIQNNLFVGNKLSDFGVYNFSGNVIYGRADKREASPTTRLTGNSFLQNYLYSVYGDSILQRASVGVFGSADSVDAKQNFWGSTQLASIRRQLYDFYTNYTSPRLLIEPILTAPLALSPPHIYQVCSSVGNTETMATDCSLLDEGFVLKDLSSVELLIRANKPVLNEGAELVYTWLNDSLQEQSRSLLISVGRLTGDSVFSLKIDSSELATLQKRPGFLSLLGCRGQNNETIPALSFGHESYLREKYLIQTTAEKKSTSVSDSSSNRSLVNETAAESLELAELKKSRFFFFIAGNISSQRIIDQRPLQQFLFLQDAVNSSYLKPGLSAGLRFDRTIIKSISASLMLNYSYLSPVQRVIQSIDTLPPFADRFASFMPRNHYVYFGFSGGLQARLTPSFVLQGGGGVDLNFRRYILTDKDKPSYRSVGLSVFSGIEVAVPNRKQLPPVWMGVRWRHWFSSIHVENVTNSLDAVEIYSGFDISLFRLKFKRNRK